MRKLGIVLSFIAALTLNLSVGAVPTFAQVGPPNQIVCNKVATLAVGPSSITQLVAAVSGQTIYVCGWHMTNTGAAGTFSFQTGTGSNCGTGTATVIPATNVTSSAPSADHIDWAAWSSPIGAALCVTPSVATISTVVFYAQF